MLLLGWVTSIVVVSVFAWSSHKNNMRPFHYVNLVAVWILVPVNIVLGASFGAFISLAFGLSSANYFRKHSHVAQLAEQVAVNDKVVGSSPTVGARGDI